MLTAHPYRYLLVAILSLVVAVTWTYVTKHMYDYNLPFASMFGVSVFPAVAWTLALVAGYFIVESIVKHVGAKHPLVQFIVVVGAYAVAVVIAETVGYHLLGIHNIGTSQYVGLPLCDCLHAPIWMQIGYFSLGPLHWLLVKMIIVTSNLWYFSIRSDKIV